MRDIVRAHFCCRQHYQGEADILVMRSSGNHRAFSLSGLGWAGRAGQLVHLCSAARSVALSTTQDHAPSATAGGALRCQDDLGLIGPPGDNGQDGQVLQRHLLGPLVAGMHRHVPDPRERALGD